MAFVIRFSAALLLIAFAILAGWAGSYPGKVDSAPRDAVEYLRHYLHFGAFRGLSAGRFSAHPAVVDARGLQPGDILLGRRADAVHGAWSHATIVLPDGRILAHHLLKGIWIAAAGDFGGYDEIRVLRPRATPEQRAVVAAWAARLDGSEFELIAHPSDRRRFTCSKAARDAWLQVGIDPTDGRFWPTPDALAAGGAPVAAQWGR